MQDSMSLAGCQINLIDVNFHIHKSLEFFDTNSADKPQSQNYKGVKVPCLMPIRVKQSRQQVLRFYCPNIFVAVFSSLPQFILQLFSAVRTIRCRTGGNRGVGRGRNVPLHPFPLKFMLDKLTIEFVPPYQKLYFWTFRRPFVEITKITVEISLLIFP